jgi:predicted RecA/RadA family phage recombinase
MKTFVEEGQVVEFVMPGTATVGIGIKVGSRLAIPTVSAASGAKCPCIVRGVIVHNKLSAQAWTVGVMLYWDDTNKWFTTVSTSNYKCGVAVLAAANPSATGTVLLNDADMGAAL